MDTQHIIVEDIDAVMRAGLTVRDAGGEKIGSVKDYSNAAAYLVVLTGLVAHKDLYVPYSAIRSIDPSEVYLNLVKDVLARQYGTPPGAKTIVEGHTASTVVPSGYDGSPSTFHRVDLEMVRRDLARDMAIYDPYGDRIGTVDGIDEQAGYMVAKRSRFGKQDLFIPFAAINIIDRKVETVLVPAGPHGVYLSTPKELVLKEYARMPDDTVLHIDDTAASQAEQPGKS